MDLNPVRDRLIERDVQDRSFGNLPVLDAVRILRRERLGPNDL